tara:strand:- start:122 stop:277 length:156 start_codon:yes stop_codon:yes gene_type:complete
MKVGTLIRKKSTNMIGIVVEMEKTKHGIHWAKVFFQNGKVWGCWESECVIL